MLDKSQHAERLGITERELQALLDVRDDLESGVIPAERFSMASDCGTACCIGGHMALCLGVKGSSFVCPEHSLASVFYPEELDVFFHATPSQAVAAIDRWIASEGREAW